MTSKGCGTCRDRRIFCDRGLPTCAQCSRSNRICQGYGLRLSWPKTDDKKRAVTGKTSLGMTKAPVSLNGQLVNVSAWDLRMHYYLSTSASKGYSPILNLTPLNPIKLELGQEDLLQYFRCTASRSLTTFGHDPTDVGNILVRVALSDDSTSAKAALRALLAFSSLHRYGLHSHAAELKISALTTLVAASKNDIGAKEVIQHIAAGMLMCSIEIQEASCTSVQWPSYICSIKKVTVAASLNALYENSDYTTLLDWMYYHDTLARFSLWHWLPRTADIRVSPSRISPRLPHITPSSFAILELLLETCDTVSARPLNTRPAQELADYKSFLKVLEWKIMSIPIPSTDDDNLDMSKVIELFQLATLVYLDRATGNMSTHPNKVQQRINRAFAIFSLLRSCEQAFPLFILGCEARTDDHRATVLDLISRTENNAPSQIILTAKGLIQSIWVQNDLADGELDYLETMSAIISSRSILPTFV